MKKNVKKEPKVALCRECRGTGMIRTGSFLKKDVPCPQCEGSGRVVVSCEMTLDIQPYKK